MEKSESPRAWRNTPRSPKYNGFTDRGYGISGSSESEHLIITKNWNTKMHECESHLRLTVSHEFCLPSIT